MISKPIFFCAFIAKILLVFGGLVPFIQAQPALAEPIKVCTAPPPHTANDQANDEADIGGQPIFPISIGNSNKSDRWNRKTITVAFMGGSEALRQRVRAVAETWAQYSSLKFSFRDSTSADIRISFRPDGSSWSAIGMNSLNRKYYPRASMNFGWLNDTSSESELSRVVLHEFGHALGFYHEHQSPAAGIRWDKQKVYDYFMGLKPPWTKKQVDDNILKAYKKSHTNFGAFDRYSIMAYHIPNEWTSDDLEIPWNTDLSETDKVYAAVIYPRGAPEASFYHPVKKKTYFFRGAFYYRYDSNKKAVDKIGRIGIDGWKGVWTTGIDAAIYFPPKKSFYFFKNDQYQRFPLSKGKVDKTAYISKDGWKGVWTTGIDAAFVHPETGNVYFFKGSQYQRFDVSESKVDKVGQTGKSGFRGVWTDSIGSAHNHFNGHVYFFRGGQYQRYDFGKDRVEKVATTGRDGWWGLQ